LRLVAALAEDRPIAAWFKWNRGLLAAACADYRRPLRRILAISTTASISAASLIVLFCLAAGLTPLGRRVAALAEKRLIGSRKGEFLSTVTAGELHISSHIVPFAFLVPVWRVPALLHESTRYPGGDRQKV